VKEFSPEEELPGIVTFFELGTSTIQTSSFTVKVRF